MQSSLDVARLRSLRGASRLEQTVAESYELLRNPVYRYLIAALGNPAEAEDLTQETFLRLFAHLQHGNSVENLRAWVFRVAHNLAIDQQRKRAPVELSGAPMFAQAESKPDAGVNPQEEQLIQERRRRIHFALARLSGQERQCLELRAEGLRYREIGEVLGIAIPTVQTAVGRAVKKLRGGL